MTTFQDVKAVFHDIGNWFNTFGVMLEGWPWPLEYLGWVFQYIAGRFYAPDWVWDGLDAWLADISALWTWAGEFAAWVTQQINGVVSQLLTWAQIEQLVGYAIGVYPLTWQRLRIKFNQSIADTLGLQEFTWSWLFSKIVTELGGAIDLNWLFTVKFPMINASIQDIWNRLTALDWNNVIFNLIGTWPVNLNTIAAWFISKRTVIDAWFDTTRLTLEADVAALKEGVSIEGIKEHLIDWIVEELDKQW